VIESSRFAVGFRGIVLPCSAFITLRLFGLAHSDITTKILCRVKSTNKLFC